MSKAADIDFGREAFKGITAKGIVFLFGFVATAYFARVLGPAVLGGYFLLLSIVTFVNRVPHGIGGACQKRLAEVDTPDDEILGVLLGTTALVAVGGTLAAFLARDLLRSYTGLDGAAFLFVLLLTAISLYVPLLFLLCSLGRFGDKEWVELLRDIVERPVQLGLVALGLGATGMAYGRLGATVAAIPLLLLLLSIRPAIPSRETVSSVWRFARANIASNVVGKAYTRFDIFLLGFASTTAAVGFYETALILTQFGVLISSVVMNGLFSKVSALDSEGRNVEDAVVSTLSYTGVIAIPQFVLVVILGGPIVRGLYGGEFVGAIPFVVGLAFYRVVQVQRETLDSSLKGLDRPDLVFRSTTTAVVVNFLVGVPLLVVYGPIGVVVGTIVAELLQLALLHRFLSSEGYAVPTVPFALRAQAGSALLMGAVVAVAALTVPRPYTPSALFGLVVLGVVTYIVGLAAVDPTVRRVLRTHLGDVRTYVGDTVSS